LHATGQTPDTDVARGLKGRNIDVQVTPGDRLAKQHLVSGLVLDAEGRRPAARILDAASAQVCLAGHAASATAAVGEIETVTERCGQDRFSGRCLELVA
jgi:hypothetical protein